jgi:hemoglobin
MADNSMSHPETSVTEDDITLLVQRFYERALKDKGLREIFEAAISDWESHHRIVEDFWSRTLLGTTRYQGRPYSVHAQLPLRPEHFDRWLHLFRQTANEILPHAAAQRAIARAEHIAESFRAGMFTFEHPIRPKHGKPA